MNAVLEKISRCGMVAVLTAPDAATAPGIARAVLRGGCCCMDVVPDAAGESGRAAAAIAREVPEMLVVTEPAILSRIAPDVGRIAIQGGTEEEITARIRAAMESMLCFTLGHVGINAPDAESAGNAARQFANLFGFPVTEAPRSFFAGKVIETLKGPYIGERGHVAINCSNVDRAIRYLETRGFRFREETVKRNPAGAATTGYLRDEVEGIAIHLRNG